ncbi:hypothetical protein ACFWPQ_02075 [Streptomyces sp. NPDC058464]|uniref:hypothetical protein n=1 Tax=Streptomyces sp. NPDC058464 TaxID=3346511 RepID=UPI00366556E2
MSTESTTKQVAPLACSACGDDGGPFAKDGLCEDCTDAERVLRSALEDGGWLDEKASQLMGAYAAAVLGRTANRLHAIPGNEGAARIVARAAKGMRR